LDSEDVVFKPVGGITSFVISYGSTWFSLIQSTNGLKLNSWIQYKRSQSMIHVNFGKCSN